MLNQIKTRQIVTHKNEFLPFWKFAKELFLLDIEGAAHFRSLKAVEYPHDKRNENSSKELELLADYVEKLPDGHILFQALEKLNSLPADDAFAYEFEIKKIQFELTRYGFDYQNMDPKCFCNKLLKMITEILKEEKNVNSN